MPTLGVHAPRRWRVAAAFRSSGGRAATLRLGTPWSLPCVPGWHLRSLSIGNTGLLPFPFALPTVESSVLDSVGRLTNLRCLSLRFDYDTTFQPDGATSARQHATALQQLSGLTALTSLQLTMPHRARFDRHWSTAQRLLSHSRAAYDAWQDVWDTQEWALGQALRCMPHLNELYLKDGLHLSLTDLAALTALTQVTVPCVSLPRDNGPEGTASLPPLPHNLCSLDTETSVETLAAMRLSASAKRLQVEDKNGYHTLWFGPGLLSEDGSRLLPAAVEAVRGAGRLLAGELAGGEEVAMETKAGGCSNGAEGADRSVWDGKPLELESRGTPKMLLPPAAAEGEVQQDHAAWIGELAPLDRRKVVFTGFTLEVTDLMCMASTFSRVKVRPCPCIAHPARRRVYHTATLHDCRGNVLTLIPPGTRRRAMLHSGLLYCSSRTSPQHATASWQPLQLQKAPYWCPDTPQVLALYGCRFPVAALPALAQLPLLETLVADVCKARYKTPDLVASMVLTAVAAQRLVRLRVSGCGHAQDVEQVRTEVQRGLALRGRSGVRVHVLGAVEEGADEEADVFEEEGGGQDEVMEPAAAVQ